jgi:predicted phage-related endonuclease
MKILEGLVQGSSAWLEVRGKYPCASEAPVIMGASRHMTRAELLRLKAAGMEKEFSDYVRRHVLDKGHEVEVPARAITEQELGEELYPATAVSDDNWGLASLDGITMTEEVLFEHKQWNEELAAAIRSGATEFPDGQEWQMEQQLIVADGAEKVIFVCSDGTAERRVQMEYRRVPGRAEKLRAAWAQFQVDLAAGVAPAAPPKAVAAPIEALPAVRVQMEGALKVVSNLDKLEPLLRAFIDRIPAKPSTDQEFADTDAACKALKRIEDELDAAEASALGSLDAVEQMQRLKKVLHALARTTRLQREKLVEARKLEIRTEEISRGKTTLTEIIAGHNKAIGKPYMPQIAADFAAAIKGLRTVQSVRDAIDQELTRARLAAADTFQRIQINMGTLREQAKDHAFLFADTATLVLKAPEDCQATIGLRIAEHKAAQEKALEAEREKIRKEEAARLEREQAEARAAEARKLQAEQEAAARAERERQEAETREQRQGVEYTLATAPPSHQTVVPAPAANVVPMPTKAPASPPTLRLGQINERLAPVQLDAAGLTALGFPPAATDKNAKLYHEADFERICEALERHVGNVRERNARKAAA